jgi:hypothetical protein
MRLFSLPPEMGDATTTIISPANAGISVTLKVRYRRILYSIFQEKKVCFMVQKIWDVGRLHVKADREVNMEC